MGQGFVRVHFEAKILLTDVNCSAFSGEIKQVFIAEILDFMKAFLIALHITFLILRSRKSYIAHSFIQNFRIVFIYTRLLSKF